MQRHDDAAARQHPFYVMKNLNAEVDVVMEVNNLRRQFPKQLLEMGRKAGIPVGKFEPIEIAGGIDVVAIGERLAEH